MRVGMVFESFFFSDLGLDLVCWTRRGNEDGNGRRLPKGQRPGCHLVLVLCTHVQQTCKKTLTNMKIKNKKTNTA